MSKTGFVSVVLFCLIVWFLVLVSFMTGSAEATTGNMVRVFAGSAVTVFMVRSANNLYLKGELF